MHELRAELHHRHRDPQHAAGRAGQRPDRVLHHGRGSRRLPCRDGRHHDDLHEPDEPADRGLRVRPVRLRREPTMTDNGEAGTGGRFQKAVAEITAAARDAGTPLHADVLHPTRSSYDRDVAEVKDNVLRMGAMVETPDPRRDPCPRHPRRRRRAEVIIDDRADQRGAAQGDGDDRRDHRHPAAGRPRPALPAHARPRRRYELERMGDHASSVAKQARKLAPHAPLKDYVELPRLGEQVADLVRGIIRALVDVDEVKAREVAALDDDVDDLYHSDLRRGPAADARGPGERRARDADPVRLALPRADRRPGDEHRRGHRVPGLGRGRGPEPVTDAPTATTRRHDHGAPSGAPRTRSGSSSCAGATARGRSSAEALLRHLGGEPDRRLLRRHRAEGRQPADGPRARGGRAPDGRASARSRSTTTSGSGSTT